MYCSREKATGRPLLPHSTLRFPKHLPFVSPSCLTAYSPAWVVQLRVGRRTLMLPSRSLFPSTHSPCFRDSLSLPPGVIRGSAGGKARHCGIELNTVGGVLLDEPRRCAEGSRIPRRLAPPMRREATHRGRQQGVRRLARGSCRPSAPGTRAENVAFNLRHMSWWEGART